MRSSSVTTQLVYQYQYGVMVKVSVLMGLMKQIVQLVRSVATWHGLFATFLETKL